MRNIDRKILVVGAAGLTLNSYLDKSHDGSIDNCAICAIAKMRKKEVGDDKDECEHCIMSVFGKSEGCAERQCRPWYRYTGVSKKLTIVTKFWEKIIELLESKPVDDFVEEWWTVEWWRDDVTSIDTATYVEFEVVNKE